MPSVSEPQEPVGPPDAREVPRFVYNFEVDLPHPRTLDMKTHAKFGEYTRRIYRLLGME